MNSAQLKSTLEALAGKPDPTLAFHRARDQLPIPVPGMASGEKAKARDIIAAIRTLKSIEQDRRAATAEEKQVLARFSGFGPVALSIFPEPVSGRYKDAGWQALGEELKMLLTPDEYDSAKRTTFNAFYTSPIVIGGIHDAIRRLGISDEATILEPGCGIGNFMGQGSPSQRFIGIELDSISGRIAKAIHPQHDIRIESFRNTKLPDGDIDAAIGNVPFSDLKLDHHGQNFSLHDYFFAKSVDALKPGGVLALVTSHFTLDKQNAALREYLADKADFVGTIRLPSDAFKREGTAVVTDIVFLRKRAPGVPASHVDDDWLSVAPLEIDGAEVSVNRYFLNHPEMVLGNWSRKDTLYGGEGFSLDSNGELAQQLKQAIERLPEFASVQPSKADEPVVPVFVPPPPERHISEGSFFVGNDRSIYQLDGGQGFPVVYSGTQLKSDGTMTGKRLAALTELRDKARRVLQSQNEGWPDDHREQARRELNRTYDRFVMAHGPINKTTFSATKEGTTVRRMPNLVKFKEDPDAMLVMSLEDYDEATGKATKAAIMSRDVVGKTPPVTQVRSAEEGLLVSLNQHGAVYLDYISQLYGKPESQVIEELGDLIFQDPETGKWETADAYLSGNVRDKLAAAERAGLQYTRNVNALREVQPEDVLPGDIDANLGAPWIPESDIQAFAAELFKVDPTSVPVAHLKKDAVWSLDAGYAAKASVAATSEFGTPRANGTWLLDLALNMKSPTIYDTIHHGDREERVINQEETMAAREKQKVIKERFRQWVFADPDRTERLVRLYNDNFNNIRLRQFDGSHLDFPGMNQALSLRQHQKDAVWRGMSSGNTLLAHVVGAGKTFTMAATGMKMKQAGLIHKPMYVVPNHLLEQFAREFMQLYPNAKLLVASKEDFTKERRKMLTAKIASGEWDGIVVTHSSFERIGMSKDYQEQFLREQIAEYDQLLIEHAAQKGTNRNLIKTIEKQKAARSEKLKNLLAEDKKDDGLFFDELGVDHVFIDEAHYFKNLETPTKMDRVAGIQTGGSERAFDVYMGVNPTPWGYSPYEEIIKKLHAGGIPREQIATMGEAESDAKKQALFEKVRQGSVRVLIGGTQKMGTGTNVQKRLIALHHLDAPWKPAEVEQRDGRILRQGNENPEVAIYRYVTEQSFDAYMWQALETKARFISQVITGDNAARRAEDIGSQELSFAEVKAIASGNPAVLTLAEADAELQRLSLLKKNHLDEQYVARRSVRDLPGRINSLHDRLEKLTADGATATDHASDPIAIGKHPLARDDVTAVLGKRLDVLPFAVREPTRVPIGIYRGLAFGVIVHPNFPPDVYLEGAIIRTSSLSKEHQGPRAALNALERIATGYASETVRIRQDLLIAESQLRDYQARLGKPFLLEAYLSELTELRDQLKAKLSASGQESADSKGPATPALAERIQSLKAANNFEDMPQRSERKQSRAEEPITARIRRRQETQAVSDQVGEQESATEVQQREFEDSLDKPPMTFQDRILRERQRRDDGEGQRPQ